MHVMAFFALAALTAGATSRATAGDAKEEAVKKDLQAFQGAWRLIPREVDGRTIREDEFKGVILTHDGAGRFSVRRGDAVIVEATVTLDPTKKPRAIDVTFTGGENKGKTVLGIYEIEGDTFRVCHARPGGERPTAFSAKAGSGHAFVVYQREKN
jgi:uncharacterized protein (TIGR03067 family)